MARFNAVDKVRLFFKKHPDKTRVWTIRLVKDELPKFGSGYLYSYGTIQTALAHLCNEGFLFRSEKGRFLLNTEENRAAVQKERNELSQVRNWESLVDKASLTVNSLPVTAVEYPEQGVVVVAQKHYQELSEKSEELKLLKKKLHAIVVGSKYDTHKETVNRIKALITEPELTKLNRIKHFREVTPKYPADMTKAVLDLELSPAMRTALVTDLKVLPRATVQALRRRDLITVTKENPGGAPYIKTRMGERVSAFLKLKSEVEK